MTRSGGERSWSCAAVNRSTTTIGPRHLGQRHSGCARGAVEASDSFFGGVAWRAAQHRGSRAARLRLARKPKWRMRTKPLEAQGAEMVGHRTGSQFVHPEELGLVLADVLRSQAIGRAVEVLGEALDEANVTLCGSLRVMTTLEFFQHHFAKKIG